MRTADNNEPFSTVHPSLRVALWHHEAISELHLGLWRTAPSKSALAMTGICVLC